MIAASSVDGGIDREAEILDAKQRIEELRRANPPKRGDRKLARPLNDRGLHFLQLQGFTEALDWLEKAYQVDPADIEIQNNLAYALMMSESDWARAEELLLLTLSGKPDRTSAWANLGQLYAKQERTTEAIACLANAFRYSDDRPYTRNFFRDLADRDPDPRVRAVANQVIQLKLISPSG